MYISLMYLSQDTFYGYPSSPYLIYLLSIYTISICFYSEHGGYGTSRLYP